MPYIKIETNDRRCFLVDIETAKCSKMIENMLENIGMGGLDEVIPLPQVDGNSLEKILTWAEFHKNSSINNTLEKVRITSDCSIYRWDKDFLNLESDEFLSLMIAANYLDIKELMDTCCKIMANKIRGKSVEEIHAILSTSSARRSSALSSTDSPEQSSVASAVRVPLYVENSPTKLLNHSPADSPIYSPADSPISSPKMFFNYSPADSPIPSPKHSPVQSPVSHSPVHSPVYSDLHLPVSPSVQRRVPSDEIHFSDSETL